MAQGTELPTDEQVFDSLVVQLGELVDGGIAAGENVLLIVPEGTTDEQYERCLRDAWKSMEDEGE